MSSWLQGFEEMMRAAPEWGVAAVVTLALALALLFFVLPGARTRRKKGPGRAQVAPAASASPSDRSEGAAREIGASRAPEAATPASPASPSSARTAPASAAPDVSPATSPPRPRSLRERLARSRERLAARLGALSGRPLDEEVLRELEALLLGADLGVSAVEKLLAALRKKAASKGGAELHRALARTLCETLRAVEAGPDAPPTQKPHVVLVLGVNGSGKTTTIGKLAARHRTAGRSVLLGAGDTFRAAAREQLAMWGERTGCRVITGAQGGDPASVAFDTVKSAAAQGIDVAIIDTAGRLQNRAPLMQELEKIVRVIGRALPGAPHETLLVIDANTGQNAVSQAREFTQAAEVSGLVLTKLDGSARGGVLVGIAESFGIPVKYLGTGEGAEDLDDFDAEAFTAALLGDGPGSS